jgi:spore coat protein A
MMKTRLLNKKKLFQTFFVMICLVSISLPVSSQPALLDPASHPKFVNPLPIPAQIDVTKGANLRMQMKETTQWLGLVNGGTPLMTKVWGYGQVGKPVTYPGPTFIAKKNVPVNVTWINNLPGHFLPVDASLHLAHPSHLHSIPEIRQWYAAGNVPAVTHLHGGHTESASDGLPEAWFTQNFADKGNYFVKRRSTYHNDQEAATLWYHDHALGITRLNVYAGLAGFYLLEDRNERKLAADGILPKRPHDIEIVIQDRMFDTDGQLFWPAYPGDPAYDDFITGENAELDRFDARDGFVHFPDGGPTALAEFFGDFIMVNGTAWRFWHQEKEQRSWLTSVNLKWGTVLNYSILVPMHLLEAFLSLMKLIPILPVRS